MAGPYVAKNGVIVTVGFRCVNHRYQWVIPLISSTVIGSMIGRANDLITWIEDTISPMWVACFASDCEMMGMQVEGMADDSIVPLRKNWVAGTYVGDAAGESCPPSSSMLAAFYSTTQIAHPDKTVVGKTFLGPSPESGQAGGTLTAGQQGLAQTLAGGLAADFVGDPTGAHWYRALTRSEDPTALIDVVDIAIARFTTFTQRRRMTPIF